MSSSMRRESLGYWRKIPIKTLQYSRRNALVEAIRRIALSGTELAKAYVGTIRLKLFKIGAVILKNTRAYLCLRNARNAKNYRGNA